MNTKLEPGRLDGGSQFRLLRQHQRGPVASLQPQPVPDHEGVGLRRSNWQRDQPENRFAGGALDPLAGDHAAQILPCGKAVADGDDGILLVVAQKQLLLRGLDRRQDRRRIGGCRAPLSPDGVEHGRNGLPGESSPECGKVRGV